VQGKDCVLFAVDDDNYGLRAGAHLPWTDCLCARMVRGAGPQAAPDVLAEPNYRTAPMLRRASIRSYIGVPVHHSNGQLFGTLCGFDPAPRGPELARHLPQVRLHARLLGTLLERELEVAETMRRAERAEMDSLADPLTGTYNRRGWMRLLKTEDARCQRYGQSAGVLMADLDDLKLINDSLGHDAGDALLVRAARALSHAVRDGDAVARIGGDEFAVLVIGVGPEEMEHLRHRSKPPWRALKFRPRSAPHFAAANNHSSRPIARRICRCCRPSSTSTDVRAATRIPRSDRAVNEKPRRVARRGLCYCDAYCW